MVEPGRRQFAPPGRRDSVGIRHCATVRPAPRRGAYVPSGGGGLAVVDEDDPDLSRWRTSSACRRPWCRWCRHSRTAGTSVASKALPSRSTVALPLPTSSRAACSCRGSHGTASGSCGPAGRRPSGRRAARPPPAMSALPSWVTSQRLSVADQLEGNERRRIARPEALDRAPAAGAGAEAEADVARPCGAGRRGRAAVSGCRRGCTAPRAARLRGVRRCCDSSWETSSSGRLGDVRLHLALHARRTRTRAGRTAAACAGRRCGRCGPGRRAAAAWRRRPP